jgi:3-oxoacyl-[acyl-carrier protein] reductase
MEIRGKRVIVTGAGRGMGRKFAEDLKARGAEPYALDVLQANLEELRGATGIPGRVVNVASEAEVEAFFAAYVEEFGVPDVLINNAGITADGLLVKKSGDDLTKMPFSSWQKVIDVNLTGVFLCTREAAYHMVRGGVRGVIVSMSSISRAGNMGQTNYTATKAGVAAMTVTWAKELARYGIRVGAIAPGFINTEMVAKIRPEILDRLVAQIPAGRLGEMEEISRAVRFIIENDFFTGRTLEVDGGMRL